MSSSVGLLRALQQSPFLCNKSRTTWSGVIILETPYSTMELRCCLAGSATLQCHHPKLGTEMVLLAYNFAHVMEENCTAYSPFTVRLTNSTASPIASSKSDWSALSSSAPNSLV